VLIVIIVLTNHFSQANGRIDTKLAQDGLRVSVHAGCAQGQGQGQRFDRQLIRLRKSPAHEVTHMPPWASRLQSNISSISIKFARWKHQCGRSLLSTIALLGME